MFLYPHMDTPGHFLSARFCTPNLYTNMTILSPQNLFTVNRETDRF